MYMCVCVELLFTVIRVFALRLHTHTHTFIFSLLACTPFAVELLLECRKLGSFASQIPTTQALAERAFGTLLTVVLLQLLSLSLAKANEKAAHQCCTVVR